MLKASAVSAKRRWGAPGSTTSFAPGIRPASRSEFSQFTRRSASPVMTSVLARTFSSRDDASWVTAADSCARYPSGGVGCSSRLRTNPSISPGRSRMHASV